jgi:hypothetical protein
MGIMSTAQPFPGNGILGKIGTEPLSFIPGRAAEPLADPELARLPHEGKRLLHYFRSLQKQYLIRQKRDSPIANGKKLKRGTRAATCNQFGEDYK